VESILKSFFPHAVVRQTLDAARTSSISSERCGGAASAAQRIELIFEITGS